MTWLVTAIVARTSGSTNSSPLATLVSWVLIVGLVVLAAVRMYYVIKKLSSVDQKTAEVRSIISNPVLAYQDFDDQTKLRSITDGYLQLKEFDPAFDVLEFSSLVRNTFLYVYQAWRVLNITVLQSVMSEGL